MAGVRSNQNLVSIGLGMGFGLLASAVVLGSFFVSLPHLKATDEPAKTETAEVDATEVAQLSKDVKRLTQTVLELNQRIDRLQASVNRKTQLPNQPSRPEPQPVAIAPTIKPQSPIAKAIAPRKTERISVPVYTKPAMAQFKTMTDEIALASKESSDAGAARDMTTALERFKGLARGSYESVRTTEPEVHVVGMYEPATGPDHKNLPAKVRVSYNGGPVILVLTSYHSVVWELEIGKDVMLETVVVSGYERQDIKGLPDTVPVLNSSRDGRGSFYSYSKTGDGYGSMLKGVLQQTGYEVTTFQGAYRYPGQPFVVGPENQDWRYQHLIAQMRELHAKAVHPQVERARTAAMELKFPALYKASSGRFGASESLAFGTFTANGPVMQSLTPLSGRIDRATCDATQSVVYTQGGEGVYRIAKGQAPELLQLPTDTPRFSWPCGLTFDTERNRVLISTLGGEGFLYSYDVTKREWSIVTSMRNVDLCCLGYDATQDCLYGIDMNRGESSSARLLRYDSNGLLIKTVKLELPHGSIGEHSGCQLIAVKGKLVFLGCSSTRDHDSHFAPLTHAYVINPETGALEFSTEMKPQ